MWEWQWRRILSILKGLAAISLFWGFLLGLIYYTEFTCELVIVVVLLFVTFFLFVVAAGG